MLNYSESTMSALKRLHSNPRRPPPVSEPSVVEDQHKWTVYNSKVNLPAALNNPMLVKRETDFFTKTWGMDFYEKTHLPTSPYLQEIGWYHFEDYVKRTSAVRFFLLLFLLLFCGGGSWWVGWMMSVCVCVVGGGGEGGWKDQWGM